MRVPPLRLSALLLLVGSAAIALACGGGPGAITGCDPADGLTPVCGFQNPEDLAPLPGGNWVAVSQFPRADGSSPGSLVAFRPADGRKVVLFPDPSPEPHDHGRDHGEASGWGSTGCPGPPDPERFGPHGIDVDRGGHRLAVVNHGGREAVELFEIGHTRQGLALVWRGCVPLPDGVWGNDVALLRDGGFLVTHMMPSGTTGQAFAVVRMLLGWNTGHVLEWQPESGFAVVAQSEGSGPNGIAVSTDGRDLYFAEWAGRRLVRLRRDGEGTVTGRDAVDLDHHPDNITWTRNGELLVTGQAGPIGEVLGCGGTENGTCALPFSVVEVGSGTLDVRVVIDHPATAQGAGTVALEVGDEVLIGTFDGDRIARTRFER